MSFYGTRFTLDAVISRTYCHATGMASVRCAGWYRKTSARRRRAIDRILNAGAVFHELGKRHLIKGQQTVFPHR